MAVAKDPAIKLFGRTISLPDSQFSDDSESQDNGSSLMTKTETVECKNEVSGMMDEAASLEHARNSKQPETLKGMDHLEEPKPPFKRPDKVLPCPRCNSSDTKFCYFNNYNVNQPRYFCKSCQRYWTAGGTVRNVPVGAGRRRNKHLASQYRQIIASSDGAPTENPESTNHQLLSRDESSTSCATSCTNEMVLKFGPESPHCDSATTMLGQRPKNGCPDNVGLPCGSSPLPPGGFGAGRSLYHYGVPPQIAMLRPNSNGGVPLGVSGYGSPDISVQYVPASYWNCIPVLVANSGNVSVTMPNGCPSPPFSSPGNGMQVLGKHLREGSTTSEEIAEKRISGPKTLKIHDQDDA